MINYVLKKSSQDNLAIIGYELNSDGPLGPRYE